MGKVLVSKGWSARSEMSLLRRRSSTITDTSCMESWLQTLRGTNVIQCTAFAWACSPVNTSTDFWINLCRPITSFAALLTSTALVMFFYWYGCRRPLRPRSPQKNMSNRVTVTPPISLTKLDIRYYFITTNSNMQCKHKTSVRRQWNA